MLEQIFEVTSTHFHAAMQMFVPLIDSVVTCRWLSLKAVKASSVTRQRALGAHRLNKLEKKVKIILHHNISKDLSCK